MGSYYIEDGAMVYDKGTESKYYAPKCWNARASCYELAAPNDTTAELVLGHVERYCWVHQDHCFVQNGKAHEPSSRFYEASPAQIDAHLKRQEAKRMKNLEREVEYLRKKAADAANDASYAWHQHQKEQERSEQLERELAYERTAVRHCDL